MTTGETPWLYKGMIELASRNKECYLCGKHYKYCSTCFQDRYKPLFMDVFCSQSCNDIFDICTRYNMGVLTKEDARKELKKCDLADRDNFKDGVNKTLDKIFTDEKKVRGTRKKTKIIEDTVSADIAKEESHGVVEKED